MEEEDEQELEHGRRKRKVTFLPSPGKQFLRSALVLALERNFFFFVFYRHHAYDLLPRPLAEGGVTRSRNLPKWASTHYAAS
jgi:hypothetical protein